MTTETISGAALAQDAEFESARRYFVDAPPGAVSFLDRVQILERAQPLEGIQGGSITFVQWPHIKEFARALLVHRQIAYLKARQTGFSWSISAYVAWIFRFHYGSNTLELSQGQLEAFALLDKARFILNNLPESWRVKFDADSRSTIICNDLNAKIEALPSTEDAGRSETASLVVQDEAETHAYLEENFLATKPTIDAGGQIIMGSTAKKRNPRSVFKTAYRGAPTNGWHKIFHGWMVRPGRDQAWYDRTRASIPETEDLSPALYMEQEYPATEEEALSPAKSVAAFDHTTLDKMQEDVKDPVATDENVAAIRYYQHYMVGKRYIAATDVGHGLGGDYSVTIVLDSDTGYVAAALSSNIMSTSAFTEHSMTMLNAYRNPPWAIEEQDWGASVIQSAQRARYKRLWHRPGKAKEKRGDVGWSTNSKTRPILWNDLVEAIEARHLTIPDKEGLRQFYDAVWNNDDMRYEAQGGTNDDWPMVVGIAWQARKSATRSGGTQLAIMPAAF